MTAPRLTTAGIVLVVGDGKVYVDGPDPVPGEEALGIPATPDEQRAWSALLMKEGAVRITIEPADAEPQPAGVALATDLLAQLKRALEEVEGRRPSDAAEELARMTELFRRVSSLANSARLALLNAQRGTP
jgi:hypothetical protein